MLFLLLAGSIYSYYLDLSLFIHIALASFGGLAKAPYCIPCLKSTYFSTFGFSNLLNAPFGAITARYYHELLNIPVLSTFCNMALHE